MDPESVGSTSSLVSSYMPGESKPLPQFAIEYSEKNPINEKNSYIYISLTIHSNQEQKKEMLKLGIVINLG